MKHFHCPLAGIAGLVCYSQSLAQGSLGGRGWRGYAISHPVVYSHRWVSLNTPVRQTAHVMICGVHYKNHKTWIYQHTKAKGVLFCVLFQQIVILAPYEITC